MKKSGLFVLTASSIGLLLLGGCKEKTKYDESAFQNDLEPLTEDEMEELDNGDIDDEMVVEDESDMDSTDTNLSDSIDPSQNEKNTEDQKKLDETGTYTDKNDVAQYIYEYGHVPSNLTAEDYDNKEGLFPVEDGVTYQQCSLNQDGNQKIIFTQDGKRVYYTDDNGKSFNELY